MLLVLLAGMGRKRAHADRKHLLLAPPGGGNIGDEAMVVSFLRMVNDPVTVVVRSRADISVLKDVDPRVEIVELPGLLYRKSPLFWLDWLRFAWLVRRHSTMSVIGADIMDGTYREDASVARAQAARLAAVAGLDARVLGFSWNGSATPRAQRAVLRASAAGVQLMAREGRSSARLIDAGASHVRQVADTVFAAFGRPTQAAVPRADGRAPLVLVNASGLVGKNPVQTSAYVAGISWLLDHGYDVHLLPHVIRSAGDDLAAARAIKAEVASERVTMTEVLLSPDEVAEMCRQAALVVTGRMHLGVLALCNGVAPVILATQGKVEGLLEYFQLSDNLVPSTGDFSDALLASIATAHADAEVQRARIREHLPEVVDLALANFGGLR